MNPVFMLREKSSKPAFLFLAQCLSNITAAEQVSVFMSFMQIKLFQRKKKEILASCKSMINYERPFHDENKATTKQEEPWLI